jgi:hypothetical protein
VIRLTDNDTGAFIGTITDDQLQFLIDELVEETEEDQDYWIDSATIDLLRADGGDAVLLDMIAAAIGDRDGIEVAWEGDDSV